MGPNMKRLAIVKASLDAIPAGGGWNDAFKFLSQPNRMIEGIRAGTKFAEDVVMAVRGAAEPNPWKDRTDEEIAGEILRQVEGRKHIP